MGFLSVLLTIIIIFWLLGFIFRVALRAWLFRQQKRFAQNFSNFNSQNQNANRKSRPEGSVEIQKSAPKTKSVDKQLGEYVEFEEETDQANNTNP